MKNKSKVKGWIKQPENFIWTKIKWKDGAKNLQTLFGRKCLLYAWLQETVEAKLRLFDSLSLLTAKTHSSKKISCTSVHWIAILKTFLPSYLLCDPSLSLSNSTKQRHSYGVILTNLQPSHQPLICYFVIRTINCHCHFSWRQQWYSWCLFQLMIWLAKMVKDEGPYFFAEYEGPYLNGDF